MMFLHGNFIQNLIKGTPITRNEQFFLDNAEAKPQIIQYMSPELMKKDKLIIELINKNNPDILKEVTKNCDISVAIMNNPELSNNELFMTVLIKEDVTKIEYISNKLRNNYDFIKNICNNNKETINYISEHTDSFGEKGLTAAKEVLVEKTTSKAISEFESELQLINKMESENKDQSEEEKKKIAIRERQLKNNMKFIQRIKEGKVDQERAIRLINSICKNLDEDYKKELMKYIKMDDALLERQDDKKMI